MTYEWTKSESIQKKKKRIKHKTKQKPIVLEKQ